MKNTLSTDFNTRQYMTSPKYEIFYYHDSNLSHVLPHIHDHFEYYFLLEGDLDYEIDQKQYKLKPGDFMLIPPGIKHRPLIHSMEVPYRRIVLWLNKNYYEELCQSYADFSYGYDYVIQNKSYHFHSDLLTSREIQGKLIDLIEEIVGKHPFHELHGQLKTASFMAYINRAIYELIHPRLINPGNELYINLCDYINTHLTEDLSLESLANAFFISKYHIAHVFKDHMGISMHQYILKKRLDAIKNGILSNIPLTQIYQEYGFRDYSSFFRAFKKEFGVSPKEYKEQFKIDY